MKAVIKLTDGRKIAELVLAEGATIEIEKPQQTATIYGKVDTDKGSPIEGVSITTDSFSTKTSKKGRYRLEKLPPGTYTVKFSKEGYEDKIVE